MTARARPPALDAAVSTLEVPGLGQPYRMFVMSDGNCLVSTMQNTLQLLTPAGQLALIAGGEDEEGFEEGKGANARFNYPCGITVDAAGHIVVTDSGNNALRRVSKAGEVSTLAGNGEEGFADRQGDAARFNCPCDVALAANDEIVVADTDNHAIRVVTPAVPCARSLATGRLALQTASSFGQGVSPRTWWWTRRARLWWRTGARRGAVRALSGGVWAGADGGDSDTAAGVGTCACS